MPDTKSAPQPGACRVQAAFTRQPSQRGCAVPLPASYGFTAQRTSTRAGAHKTETELTRRDGVWALCGAPSGLLHTSHLSYEASSGEQLTCVMHLGMGTGVCHRAIGNVDHGFCGFNHESLGWREHQISFGPTSDCHCFVRAIDPLAKDVALNWSEAHLVKEGERMIFGDGTRSAHSL